MKTKQILKDYGLYIQTLQLNEPEKELIRIAWLKSTQQIEALAHRNFVLDNVFSGLSIVCGILTPSLVTWDGTGFKIAASVTGILSAISVGALSTFKFGDKWKNFRKTSEALKTEGGKYFALAEGYESGHAASLAKFIENISVIKQGQITEYIKTVQHTSGLAAMPK